MTNNSKIKCLYKLMYQSNNKSVEDFISNTNFFYYADLFGLGGYGSEHKEDLEWGFSISSNKLLVIHFDIVNDILTNGVVTFKTIQK